MLKLKTSAANLLAIVKEKLSKGIRVLSPEESLLWQWARKMQRQAQRREYYRSRNAAYPYQSERQRARNLAKMQKADRRLLSCYGWDLVRYQRGLVKAKVF